MGFLEDLIKTVQEAELERRRQAGLPVPPTPERRQQAQVSRRTRPQPVVQAEEVRPAAATRPLAAETAPASVQATPQNQYARLLRQPRTVRTALILSELLQ